MKFFFTADTHFNHDNIIQYCLRPFKNVEEMNETLITNWNSVVGEKDTVYHLGDFAFLGGTKRQLKLVDLVARLNGNIIVIPGSHDKGCADLSRPALNQLTVVRPSHTFFNIGPHILSNRFNTAPEGELQNPQMIVMCHYAMRVWPYSHYGSWQIHGHSHGHIRPQGKQHDVGVDNNGYFPVSLDQLKAIMAAQPSNFDLVE